MLHVKLQINGRLVGVLDILNDQTNRDETLGNYVCKLAIEDQPTELKTAVVRNFPRNRGPWALVREALEGMEL